MSVSFTPEQQTVDGGEVASFEETIMVPDGTAEGTMVSCQVVFTDENGNELGTQDINVKVPDTTAPVAQCVETTNPAGKNTPKAGNKSPGQNEDGIYELLARDAVDESPEIYVVDSETGHVFGPFESGTKIKYTEANGAEPSQTEMAGGGNANAVDWKLKGQGDAIIYAVDESDNTSERFSCLVPNPDK